MPLNAAYSRMEDDDEPMGQTDIESLSFAESLNLRRSPRLLERRSRSSFGRGVVRVVYDLKPCAYEPVLEHEPS